MHINRVPVILFVAIMLSSCGRGTMNEKKDQNTSTMFTPIEGKIHLMNLDPGHFHAGLVQKIMYDAVDPVLHVYAPKGPELEDYLTRIRLYNSRPENPTAWKLRVYTGSDYFEKMITGKPGNVMIVSGNNSRKTEYILGAVKAGIHVLADKPMVIDPAEFPLIEEAFSLAEKKGILLYDIMTERYEATTKAQKLLSMDRDIFGTLLKGSVDQPAITKESVHHFSKIVSGKPLIRPAWFFDTRQQGEGLVDVTTHLVDLVQWEAFPEVTLDKSDVEILSARRWTTDLTMSMFEKVTGLKEYPDFLQRYLEEDLLKVYSNGEINYSLKGVHAKVSVIWNFEAPGGTGDTHHSIMRGSKVSLVIRQGKNEGFKPTLYLELNNGTDPETYKRNLQKKFHQCMDPVFPGIELRVHDEGSWIIDIPDRFKMGHEAHFGQVTEKYLDFLASGNLPEWEIPNMIVKYYTTTGGLLKARE